MLPWGSTEWYGSCGGCLTNDTGEVGCCNWCSNARPPHSFGCWWGCCGLCWPWIGLKFWLGTEKRLTVSDVNVVADPISPLSHCSSPGVDAVVIAIITVVVEATRWSCIIVRSSEVATDATERDRRSLSSSPPVKDSSDDPSLREVPPIMLEKYSIL